LGANPGANQTTGAWQALRCSAVVLGSPYPVRYVHLSYELRIHDDAWADLERLTAGDADLAARMHVFIEEFLLNDRFRISLAVHGFESKVVKNVTRLSQWFRTGYGLWRIKLMGMDARLGRSRRFLNHRVVYAFDDAGQILWVLGFFSRDEFDYDPRSHYGQRICRAYDGLGLPRVRVH
jgi:hypothetical protein